MSTNCSECFRGCTVLRILKARASAWRRCNASLTSTEAKCARRGSWTKAQPSISPSVWEKKLDRKVMEPRREADYELRGTGHIVSGRQSGRRGPCPAYAAAGEAGEPHLRGPRWRASPGLSLLSRGVRAPIVRSSAQAGSVGFETAQGRWDGSAQTDQERSSNQDYPGRHHDLVERRAGF